MTDPRASALLRWLPPPSLPGLRQRGLIVCGVALVIALVQWLTASRAHPLLASLVYSYAISLCIWFFTDPLRIALHRWLRTEPPHYWALNPRSLAWLVVGIVLGYVLGITAGDLYVGQSTWALLAQAPQRFWGVWLGALGISLGFLFYFYQREKALALQHEATEAQLRLLESQLEPHMLFNTLANLRALIATDPPRALTMLDRLNDYLRATLRASRTHAHSTEHTLAHEFARLHDYLELMAVRMGPRLRTHLHLPEHLQHHPVAPLLLQPLVENAIRHGLEPSLEGGTLSVVAHAAGGQLVLDVSDTGMGFDGEPTAGFGLSQVRQRLATAYPGRASCALQSSPGNGTTATVRMPLQTPPQPHAPPA